MSSVKCWLRGFSARVRRRRAGRGAHRGGVRAGRPGAGGAGGLPGGPPPQQCARVPLHVGRLVPRLTLSQLSRHS